MPAVDPKIPLTRGPFLWFRGPDPAFTFLWSDEASYPDAVARPALAEAELQYATEISPAPEQTIAQGQFAFPDVVARPALAIALVVTGEEALPERTAPAAYVECPTTVARPASFQVGFVSEEPPYPEGRLPLNWDPFYSPTAPGPKTVPFQLYSIDEPPAPERTSPSTGAVFPDNISRPSIAFQLFEGLVQLVAATTPTEPFVSYPDSVTKPRVLPYLESFETIRERSAPIAAVSYPDSLVRLSLLQVGFEAGTKSENTVAEDWQSRWPDSLSLPRLAFQLFSAADEAVERTSPLASGVFPDSISRRTISPGYATEFGAPEVTVPDDWQARYPDAVTRSGGSYLFSAVFVGALERKTPIATTNYPDAVKLLRPSMSFAFNGFVPETTLPIDWQPRFPDSLALRRLSTGAQLFSAGDEAPERTRPLASTSFPDSMSVAVRMGTMEILLSMLEGEVSPEWFSWTSSNPLRAPPAHVENYLFGGDPEVLPVIDADYPNIIPKIAFQIYSTKVSPLPIPTPPTPPAPPPPAPLVVVNRNPSPSGSGGSGSLAEEIEAERRRRHLEQAVAFAKAKSKVGISSDSKSDPKSDSKSDPKSDDILEVTAEIIPKTIVVEPPVKERIVYVPVPIFEPIKEPARLTSELAKSEPITAGQIVLAAAAGVGIALAVRWVIRDAEKSRKRRAGKKRRKRKKKR